jgi:hypothetical protein
MRENARGERQNDGNDDQSDHPYVNSAIPSVARKTRSRGTAA